jgi:predicted phage terminase large subunit-like protein
VKIEDLLAKSSEEIAALPAKEQREILKLIEEYQEAQAIEAARTDFMAFVRYIWPEFIYGPHHQQMADAFQRMAEGKLKRSIINLGPRHTKSEFASFLHPAWRMGRNPKMKIIQCSHSAELAEGFGRRVRDLIQTKEFKKVFPECRISATSGAAHRWATDKGGTYVAIGVDGKLAGRGADLLIIDDPHAEAESVYGTDTGFERVYNWYKAGPRQRLQPGGQISVVMTRWSKKDLSGQLLASQTKRDGEEWEIIELPAVLYEGTKDEKALWPQFWSLEELKATKKEVGHVAWAAQYLQNPVSREAVIISRDKWKIWEDRDPPPCDYVIQTWDTAHEKGNRNDPSAMQTWGVFHLTDEDTGIAKPNIILLDAFKKRMHFPELKRQCLEEYRRSDPDSVLVEGRASGKSLVQELRSMGLPIVEYTVGRGTAKMPNDKISRVNSVSDIFESGLVWAPETRFAEEVMDEVADFPAGEHDDYVDCMVMALRRFRDGGFIRLDNDFEPEPLQRRRAAYY